MQIRMLVALLAAVLSLGLVACGGDDEDAEPPAEVEREAPEETTEESAEEESAGAEEVSEVSLVEFAFEPPDIAAEQGTTLDLTNDGDIEHDLRVREAGEDIGGTPRFDPGEEEELEVDFDPGEYEIYCSVPGHEESGMVGTMSVE